MTTLRHARGALAPWKFGSLLWVVAILLGAARASEPGPATGGTALKPQTLRVVFRDESFVGVNANDAAAAFKVLAQTVGRKRGYDVTAEVSVLDSESTYLEALKSGAFDLAIVDPWVYVQHRLDTMVRPDFVTEENDGLSKRFMLLTRTGSGCTNLASLKGRKLMALSQAHADLGRHWLDTVTTLAGLGKADAWFETREGALKAAGVVLPVFFGKRDAALVDSGSFAMMVEMNPQVGKTLAPILISEPLSNALVGTRAGVWASEDFRRDLLSAMADLQSEVAGRQVLVLFKIKALVPPSPGQLDTVRALYAARLGGADGREIVAGATPSAAAAAAGGTR